MVHASAVLLLVCAVWTVDAISNIKSAKNLIGTSPKPEWRLSNAMQSEIEAAGIDSSLSGDTSTSDVVDGSRN